MPNPTANYDAIDLIVPINTAQSNYVAIGNPTELGLFVPTLTAATLTVKVAQDTAGTGAQPLFDGTGTQKLVYASGTGGFAISSNEMGACLGYGFIGVTLGANQAAARTLTLTRKLCGVDVTA